MSSTIVAGCGTQENGKFIPHARRAMRCMSLRGVPTPWMGPKHRPEGTRKLSGLGLGWSNEKPAKLLPIPFGSTRLYRYFTGAFMPRFYAIGVYLVGKRKRREKKKKPFWFTLRIKALPKWRPLARFVDQIHSRGSDSRLNYSATFLKGEIHTFSIFTLCKISFPRWILLSIKHGVNWRTGKYKEFF